MVMMMMLYLQLSEHNSLTCCHLFIDGNSGSIVIFSIVVSIVVVVVVVVAFPLGDFFEEEAEEAIAFATATASFSSAVAGNKISSPCTASINHRRLFFPWEY
mmetsp:Transcript_11013/g.10680  ORF Transcript_11013/g.10680 Transcript_11013/m.10680 type:complete len:102 (-) Transcript_11013:704-1009(-)